jgi:uncharacterized OsmC-like protein
MNSPDRNHTIKVALDRLVDAYKQRPSFAESTASVTARVEDGLTCTISDDHHTVISDLPEIMGGENAGPTPGFYARAGIAGCVSIGIKMMAARAGHDFRKVSVDVEMDFDDRPVYGLCAGSAAPLETRVKVDVECDLLEDDASAFILDVLEHDTFFLGLRDAQSVKTIITVSPGS